MSIFAVQPVLSKPAFVVWAIVHFDPRVSVQILAILIFAISTLEILANGHFGRIERVEEFTMLSLFAEPSHPMRANHSVFLRFVNMAGVEPRPRRVEILPLKHVVLPSVHSLCPSLHVPVIMVHLVNIIFSA